MARNQVLESALPGSGKSGHVPMLGAHLRVTLRRLSSRFCGPDRTTTRNCPDRAARRPAARCAAVERPASASGHRRPPACAQPRTERGHRTFEVMKCFSRREPNLPATGADQPVDNLAQRASGRPRTTTVFQGLNSSIQRLAGGPTGCRHLLSGGCEPVVRLAAGHQRPSTSEGETPNASRKAPAKRPRWTKPQREATAPTVTEPGAAAESSSCTRRSRIWRR